MSLAATSARRVRAQARFEVGLLLRNGEQLLVAVILPALALIGLANSPVPDLGPGPRIAVVVPGILALCVISSAFTAQAIATGFDRRYSVLRYLGVTPLGRSGLLQARVLATLVVVAVQSAIMGLLGTVLGWRPSVAGLGAALVFLVAGTATFVALGLLLGGTLRAEGVLAIANLIWVLLLALGGVVVPREVIPGGVVGTIAGWLPSGGLADGLRAAFVDGTLAVGPLAILVAWGVVAALLVRRWFRWSD